MQNDEKDYVGAQSTIIEALRYLEPLDEIINTGDCYNVLGNALANIGEYEEARNNYVKSRIIFSKSLDTIFKTGWELYLINNIGYTYLLDKSYKKAKKYFEEGLKHKNIENDYPNHYQVLLGNYSDCIYELGQPEQTFKNYKEILKLRELSNNLYGQSLSHNGIAYYYEREGEKGKALYHAKKGYYIAKKVNNNYTLLSALTKLANLTSGEESKRYFNEYVSLSDSLNNRERYLKNQFAKVRYETEKKDKENEQLKIEKEEEAKEAQRQRQQKIIGWLVSLVAILGLGFSATYFRARRKKLMYEAQLQKASVREEERQQIAKSLHDEVAGDLRMLHQKLSKTDLDIEAKSIEKIKENVRNLSHQLSSVSFEEVSFKDQIINLVSDAFSPNFRVSVEGIDDVLWKEINSQIKRTLYLCIRESLQNTLKYANATKFFISFSLEKKEILVHLKDNGKGFELGKKKKGIGLKNLKERVEEIQGSFHIESSDQGTKTTVSIPINGR
ncbi:ATP-binding protein [Pseudotenacibaculum sp. MALMAid0570]|uniref:tetratricopeptide repeat-containing sensor histidine kinase n=1 Tax=Pseudotenacibaculum sp. MALMAid0570 TaxID=3143938 RepID=UPI0032DEB806